VTRGIGERGNMMNTRSTYSTRAAATVALFVSLVVGAAAQTQQEQYEEMKQRDDAARAKIAATAPAAPTSERTRVITEARAVIAAYEGFVRRHRASGYADNALHNAASLAEALHAQFALTTDLDAAVRLYKRLSVDYPTAPLAKAALTTLERLQPLQAAAVPPPPAVAPTPTPAPARAGRARLTAIERTVLPEVVRVTLSLDREVRFQEETLTGPARVFFDLTNVEAAPTLTDAVLRYPADIVRQIRVGRHPNAVRVVLDLEGVTRHSVYTLYNPFRIVIDAEGPTTASSTAPPPASHWATVETRERATAPRAVAPPAPPAPAVRLDDEKPVVLSVARDSDLGGATHDVPVASSAGVYKPGTGSDAVPAPGAPPARPLPSATPAPPTPAPAPVVPNRAGGFSIARQLGLGVSRVVIDPGHGGHDPGAQTKGLNEADLTLDIALRLEKLLLDEPGLQVVLTRRTDVYVPLEERTAIANREGADLFLSIHANTSRSVAARGIETYFLSFAGSPDAEAVAARENASHAGEMHKLPDIVKAITLNNKLDESRDFAGMVQEALVTRLRRANKTVVNRGVKKAPFVVLIGAEMPSVLAEVSFLSNKQELQLLKSSAYKQRIAEALHAAIMRYRRSLKGVSAVAAQSDEKR
jgi:N-acetylmuramoyl-L-alanine amidase